MKQYKFLTGKGFKSVSDGTSFVVTTSMKAYRECKNGFSIHLFCASDMYWLFTIPPDYFSTYSDTTRKFKNVKWNLVVRVDKLAGVINPAFTTYINGEYLASTRSRSCLVTRANGSTINISIQPPGLPITLVIFNDSELGNVKKFVQEMRNSGETYFDLDTDECEGIACTHGGPSIEVTGCIDLNSDGSEGTTATHSGPSSTPRTDIHSPDADIAGHFDLNGDGSEGIGSAHDKLFSASRTEVYPPNANVMNLSSTLAWKRVVHNVLSLSKRVGSVFALKGRGPQQRQRQVTGDGSDGATAILNSEGGSLPIDRSALILV